MKRKKEENNYLYIYVVILIILNYKSIRMFIDLTLISNDNDKKTLHP